MLEVGIISVLVGAVLALRFRVLALLVAIPFMLAVVAVGGVARGMATWWTAIAMVVATVSVQLGYLGGSILWLATRHRSRGEASYRSSAHLSGQN